jgi:hypothetical protein
MEKTKQSANGTSFFFTTIKSTVNQLRTILGDPTDETNDGNDKVNFEWAMETKNGEVFTVYDWKEYRQISETEEIEWHIGGFSKIATENAKNEILEALCCLP